MALRTLAATLTALGADTGKKCILDIGDSACVATLADTQALDTSGNGSHFNKGSCAFNGTPGNRSAKEHASRPFAAMMEGAAHDAWMDALHKDNAVYSLLLAVFVPLGMSNSTSYMFIGNAQFAGSTRQGIAVGSFVNGSGQAFLSFLVGTTTNHAGALNKGHSVFLKQGAWHLIQISMNEASATGCDIMVNGFPENSSAVYTSPTGSNAVKNFRFFSTMDDNSFSAPGGLFIASFAVLQGAGSKWTAAQNAAIFNEHGLRFGLAPEPRVFQPIGDGFTPEAPGFGSLECGMALAA